VFHVEHRACSKAEGSYTAQTMPTLDQDDLDVLRIDLEPLRDLMLHWNRAHNLVSRKSSPDQLMDLLLDAALFSPFLAPASRVVDLGSGAGIPGLVLAVLRPDLQLSLLEPRQKRCQWLTFATGELGCSGKVLCQRWDPQCRAFDRVVSRAVFPPPIFCQNVGALAGVSLQMTGKDAVCGERTAYRLRRRGVDRGLILAGASCAPPGAPEHHR
jgi:16S rRNA (guanine(527)-N(7))-methyltransferase RsmG